MKKLKEKMLVTSRQGLGVGGGTLDVKLLAIKQIPLCISPAGFANHLGAFGTEVRCESRGRTLDEITLKRLPKG